MYGELIPLGGGDPIPLLKQQMLVGRRESCDIILRFANVSAHHCQLSIENGYLYVRDLQSRNGIKVNDIRVSDRRLDPGDTISIAKHRYRVEYDPAELGAVGPPPPDNLSQEIMRESLLSRAGLNSREAGRERPSGTPRRYDPTNNRAGQIKLPDEAL
jgi:pSer/pThr/pTyr-binding forkhead associated (FHA) protein